MPLDSAWLRLWIQRQHLVPETLRAYRRAARNHPARLLVLHDFLVAAAAERAGRFLLDEIDRRVVYGLHSRPPHDDVTSHDWMAATDDDRLYRFSVSAGARPPFRLSVNAASFLKLRRALHDARFLRFFESATGLALGVADFDAHVMRAGDFLGPHTDAFDNRRLACVLFLSPGWQPRFGGALHITTTDGAEWTIDAAFNTLVIFDVTTGTRHFVDPIAPAEVDRVTLGGWIDDPIASPTTSASSA